MKKILFIALLLTAGITLSSLILAPKPQQKSAPAAKIGTNVGDKAPEIELPGTDGKNLKLSSLKGNVVLIDFWASWCGPCRRENPNVVEAYQKYKSRKFKDAKGFKIFSVSLDKTKEPWLKAIQTDKLDWSDHVSDLKGWQSQASALYGVNSIPASFLLDANGIIIAKNLRGMDLHYQLEKLAK